MNFLVASAHAVLVLIAWPWAVLRRQDYTTLAGALT